MGSASRRIAMLRVARPLVAGRVGALGLLAAGLLLAACGSSSGVSRARWGGERSTSHGGFGRGGACGAAEGCGRAAVGVHSSFPFGPFAGHLYNGNVDAVAAGWHV